MRKITKILISFILAGCIMLQICGCSSDKKTADAGSICSLFCEDVKNGDADKLMTYFGGQEITAGELKEIISPSGFNSEEKAVSDCIRETLNYKVQEPVYDYNAKTATVYLSWELADYGCEAAVAAKSLIELKAAIKAAPVNIITVCVTVDLNGETPGIINPKDVIEAVYAFNSADHGIMPGLVSDYYSSGSWVSASNDVYTNTEEICVRLNFKKDIAKYRFVPGYIYTVAKGDKVLFTSDILPLSGSTADLKFTSGMTGPEGLNEDGFLKAGTYTVMVFDEHSNDIASFKCEVKNEVVEKDEIEFEEYDDDHYINELVFDFKDDDFKSKTAVGKSGWWDYDGTSVGKSAFGSDTTIIGFSLAINTDDDTELYFEYYYSDEADFGDVSELKPVYQRSCKPSLYQDQSCYDLDYSSGDLKPGYYGLVVYKDAAKKHIVFTAACLVIEETSVEALED